METAESNIPQCIGIIPDGNRRWARGRNMPTLEGHRAGYFKFKEVLDWAFSRGIGTVYAYAFSTENWHRAADEVDYLMKLLGWVISKEKDDFIKRGVRVKVLGDRATFPRDIIAPIEALERETENNARGTLALLFSYGGRQEILAGVKNLLDRRAPPSEITEASFREALWSRALPDPDLIIRTGGVERLSNFLIWEAAYAEFAFTKTLWPDFTETEFDSIIQNFAGRERRFGK